MLGILHLHLQEITLPKLTLQLLDGANTPEGNPEGAILPIQSNTRHQSPDWLILTNEGHMTGTAGGLEQHSLFRTPQYFQG